jgi:aspartate 1-decarboxylase
MENAEAKGHKPIVVFVDKRNNPVDCSEDLNFED